MPAPTLSIPTPCHEDWQQMTPTGPGRHCAACQKVVVDFTHFTDTELLLYWQQQAGQVTCGRFRTEQLARPLLPLATAKATRWRAWLAAAAAVWGLREAGAPSVRAQASVEQRESAGKALSITLGVPAVPPVVVRGTVSGTTGPLPGATVELAGTPLRVTCDATGHFEMVDSPLTRSTSRKELVVSFVGYVPQRVALAGSLRQSVAVTLTPNPPPIVGEIVLAGEILTTQATPWYNPRSLWQQLRQPFRRW